MSSTATEAVRQEQSKDDGARWKAGGVGGTAVGRDQPRLIYVAGAYVVCALIWGTTWFSIRASIAPGGYPTFASAAIRFSLAAAVLLPWCFRKSLRLRGLSARAAGWLAAAGVLNALVYALVYEAERDIPGGLTAVLFGVFPLMAAILVTVTGAERVRRAEFAGALIAVSGIALVFADRAAVSSSQTAGIVLVLAAVLVSAIYSLIVKRHAADVHPLLSVAIFFSVTSIAMWTATIIRGWEPIAWPPAAGPTIAVIYLGLCGSAVAFGLYFYVLKHMTMVTASSLLVVSPVIALAVDALWEHRIRLESESYLGIFIVVTGLVVGLLGQRGNQP